MTPDEFNNLIHRLRTAELQKTAAEPDVMINVGVPDAGYFEWINANMGCPNRHIALEYYRKEPANLPDNVTWIGNTASNMVDVKNESAGTIFAGQVIEHLWAPELAGFILEASRVLKPAGRLIIDSPNEIIVRQSGWNHPEHTIELQPQDISSLLSLAGFEVTKLVGHWLCRSGSGKPLPLLGDETDTTESIDLRVSQGISVPQDSFSWWVEARKAREPRSAALVSFVTELWNKHWSTRIHRQMYTQISEFRVRQGQIVATAPLGWSGLLAFGPCAPLPAGRSLVGFEIEPYRADESPGKIEVFSADHGTLAETSLAPILPHREKVWLEINLPTPVFGLEFRLHANGRAEVTAAIGPDVIISLCH